jgi:hypothetical protein
LQKQKKKLTTVLKKSRPAAVYTPKTKKSKSTLEQETPTTSPVTNAKAKTKAIAKAKTKAIAKAKASQKKKNKRPTPKIPKIKNQSCQKLSAPPKHRVVPPFCATNCIGKIKQGLNGNVLINKTQFEQLQGPGHAKQAARQALESHKRAVSLHSISHPGGVQSTNATLELRDQVVVLSDEWHWSTGLPQGA